MPDREVRPGTLEPFELSMLGGAVERRYRSLRPEVETLPWGTLRPEGHAPHVVEAARRVWTEAAFQEHRTGAACAATLEALISARAPLDLIAVATRFPLDELVHVELCARLVMELGGGVRWMHDPLSLIQAPDAKLDAVGRAAELVVRYFCIGEAVSIPLLHGSWRAAKHPLVRAVLGRIVRDEAAHGQFGWLFLDWAVPRLDAATMEHLRRVSAETLDLLRARWDAIGASEVGEAPDPGRLGWMESEAYLRLARRSLERHVLAPLRARGLDPTRRQ